MVMTSMPHVPTERYVPRDVENVNCVSSSLKGDTVDTVDTVDIWKVPQFPQVLHTAFGSKLTWRLPIYEAWS